MVYWRLYFENEIPVNWLFTQWMWTYILDLGPWRRSTIWDLWTSGLQECKGNSFSKIGRVGNNFRSGTKNLDFLVRRLPLPDYSTPKKFVWGDGDLTSSHEKDAMLGGIGRIGVVLHHLWSLLGATKLTILCAFICKVEYVDAQIRETLL
jgi:hypothetical protein